MPLQLQNAVIKAVLESTAADVLDTPSWLIRPGKTECKGRWMLICRIYSDLTGLELPEVMRPVERRKVDLVFQVPGERARILEVDEKQHFNEFRAQTLEHYKSEVPLAFDAQVWLDRCQMKGKLEGGGFAKPKPPLFPGENGRHRQRAYRDALCDILPPEHEYLPTLRIGHFEVENWIYTSESRDRMRELLEERL